MEKMDIQHWIDQLRALDTQTLLILIGSIIGVLVLWLIVLSLRGRKKKRARKIAPELHIQQIQVAPLGKGVQVKLVNRGFPAIIKDIEVLKRPDIEITQAFTDYQLDRGKQYIVFCENTGSGRADDGFDIRLHYTDQLQNTYQQQMHIVPQHALLQPAKVKRYA